MIINETYFKMSDGVRLYTRIVLPEENKKYPIVFIRTPYEEERNGIAYPRENYENDLFFTFARMMEYQTAGTSTRKVAVSP